MNLCVAQQQKRNKTNKQNDRSAICEANEQMKKKKKTPSTHTHTNRKARETK